MKIKLPVIAGILLMFVLTNAQTPNTNSAPKPFVVSTTIISLNQTNGKNFKSVFRVFVANQPDNGLLMIHSSKMSNIVQVTRESRANRLFTNSTVFKGKMEGVNVFTKAKIGTNDISFTAVPAQK